MLDLNKYNGWTSLMYVMAELWKRTLPSDEFLMKKNVNSKCISVTYVCLSVCVYVKSAILCHDQRSKI